MPDKESVDSIVVGDGDDYTFLLDTEFGERIVHTDPDTIYSDHVKESPDSSTVMVGDLIAVECIDDVDDLLKVYSFDKIVSAEEYSLNKKNELYK